MHRVPLHPSYSVRPFTSTLAVLGLAALLAGSLDAQAAPEVLANASALYIGSDTPAQTASSGTVIDVDSGTAQYNDRFGSASASASFGELHAYSTIGVIPQGSSFESAFSQSTASFRDDFLIDAPGLTGTSGSVTVRFTIDGSLSVTTNGTPSYSTPGNLTYARAGYTFGVDPNPGDTTIQRMNWDGSSSGTQFLGIEQVATLYFTYGVALQNVTLRISTFASAVAEYNTYNSTATADLSHTALWGGFRDVKDAGGNVVTNYTFSSSSGTDFTQAVPEPGTSLLVGFGFALALLRRRRHQS